MKIVKYNKIYKEILKNIINIIMKKYNYLFKKYILNIDFMYINKNFSKLYIYTNINNNYFNNKKLNYQKNIIKILNNSKNYIKKLLYKKTFLNKIPKIYFKIDNFYNKNKKLFNILNKINK